MDKNSKKKAGLHKEISSIFDGVPVPDKQSIARPQGGPAPGQAGFSSPRPSDRNIENPRVSSSRGERGRSYAGGSAAAGRGKPGGPRSAGSPLRQMTDKLFASKAGVSAKRQKVMVLLVPILLVVLVIVLMNVLGMPSSKSTWTPKPPDTTAAVGGDTEIEWQKPEPYPTTLRDPMELPPEMAAQVASVDTTTTTTTVGPTETGTGPETASAGALVVKGILFSNDNPTAVVGTEIAHIGDMISGAKVVAISKNEVEFEKDGKKWTQAVEP